MIINVLIDDVTSTDNSITPQYSTDLIRLQSGFTLADKRWKWPRHEYTVDTPVLELPDIEQRYMQLFHYTYGPAKGFLFRDWADFKSCPVDDTISVSDQVLKPSEDNPLEYPITKLYSIASREFYRRIYRPIEGTLIVATDQSYTIDYTLGILTFTTLPTVVTCGFEFYVPVRFKDDPITIEIVGNKADDVPVGKVAGLSLLEVIPSD